jgi:hypothetical protein
LRYDHSIAFYPTTDKDRANETIITTKIMVDAKHMASSVVFRFYMISRLFISNSMEDSDIKWAETIKKEACGVNGLDLGEVQQVELENIITQKGTIEKEQYRIPKKLVEKFDGNTLWFNVTKDGIDKYTMKQI